MKKINLITAVIAVVMMISWLPKLSSAQEVTEIDRPSEQRTYMFFNLTSDGEFAPGRSVVTSEIYQILSDETSRIQELAIDSRTLTVVGTQDSLRFDCRVVLPQTEKPTKERRETCDADLSSSRSDVISGMVSGMFSDQPFKQAQIRQVGLTIPNTYQDQEAGMSKIQQLMNQRGFFLVFDRISGQTDQGARLSELKATLRGEIDEVRDIAEAAMDSAQKALAENDAQDVRIDQNKSDIAELQSRPTASGTNVDFVIGAGVRQFDDVLMTPAFFGGIEINGDGLDNFSAIVWTGYKKGAKSAVLSDRGAVDINRLSYGFRAAWYPISGEYLSAGPSLGWSHSEDIVDETSKHIRKGDALDVGVSLAIHVTDWLDINGYAGYTPVSKESIEADYELNDAQKSFSGSAGISLNF